MEGYTSEDITLVREFLTVLPILHRYIFMQSGGCKSPIPASQMLALLSLNLFPCSSMTQLATRLMVSKQQLTKIVDSLVEKNMVRRMSSEENRRLVLLELTDKGTEVIEKMQTYQAEKASRLFSQITEEERLNLIQSLELIRRILKQQTGTEQFRDNSSSKG